MRTAQNTLDLRGQRYDDAERETDFFLDRMTRSGGPCYILHGHGTGALKTGLRRFLKSDARGGAPPPPPPPAGGGARTRGAQGRAQGRTRCFFGMGRCI